MDLASISGGGAVSNAVNIGTGDGVFAQLNGTILEFKSLVAGANITLTPSGTEIEIATGAGVGEANTTSNVGTGEGLALPKVVVDLPFKSLIGEANKIILIGNAEDVTFTIGTDIVTLTDVQTLTNKILTTPTIASFVNATHDHEDAIGGGQLTATDALDATGTTDATTFLRGDNTWAVPPGTGEANTISSLGGGTILTAAVPKLGVNLQTVSIATTAPIAHVTVADLLTFSLDPLVNADIAVGAAIDVAKLADGNPGQFIRTDAAGTGVEYADDIASISFIIDGGGSTLTLGNKGDLEIPFNCTIERVTLLADQTGDVEIDLFVDTFANYPPVLGDSIVAAAPPTITAADNSQDATLTGWITALASGSTIRYNINSVTTIERVTIVLLVRKTG